MGRWGDAFQACMQTHDTADTVDSSSVEAPAARLSVSCVNSVMVLEEHAVLSTVQLKEVVSAVSAVSGPNEIPSVASQGRPGPMLSNCSSGAATAPTPIKRPVSWADATDRPTPGSFCSCCQSHRWWSEMYKPSGWRCWTCHPPDHQPAETVMEIRT